MTIDSLNTFDKNLNLRESSSFCVALLCVQFQRDGPRIDTRFCVAAERRLCFVVFVRLTEFRDRQHAKAAARPRPRKQIAEAGEGGDILREIVLRDKIYSKHSTSLSSFEPAAFSEPWVSTY